jgi:catechol 2,3-dioxygenase-like lactoylglutathione lyase family enzyme
MGVQPVALSGAHLEARSLEDTIPVLTDLLALEKIGEGSDSVILKHPNTPWVMTVHEGGGDASLKDRANHYGVRVVTKEELTVAHQYLNRHADEYGLTEIRDPEFAHGSYSVYFTEPGTNTLEIECYEDVNRKAAGIERLGGVRGPHWTDTMPTDRFPGRGYVPQAFTHGTLATEDPEVSVRFYSEVLNLDVHNAYGEHRVVYVKHPETKHFIVCAKRAERTLNPPSFRYTLTVASAPDLEAAHRWVSDNQGEYKIAEVHEIENHGDASSFLLRDPDLNWWEIAAQH